jgi:hypothetical protein
MKKHSIKSIFENNRDPYHARQLADQGKSESVRRDEALSHANRRESFMVKRQQPKPVLRPSPALSYGSDLQAFNRQWTKEQKCAKPISAKKAFKNKRRVSSTQIRPPKHKR